MQTDMGGYQPWQAGTSGSLKAYEPTWRDKLARVLMGEQRASPERARLVEGLAGSRGLGNTGMGLVDFVPGVGNAFQAQEEARRGEGANMMFAMVGGPAAKVPKPGPQLATGNALSPNIKAPRPEPEGLIPEAKATGLSRVLAETGDTLQGSVWRGNHPYARAEQTADALRQAIPGPTFEVVRSGSAAGDSAYIKTPLGDIRISDHGAHPKPGIFWQGPSDQMSPQAFVDLVKNKMDETVSKLLAGKPPNQYGSPRPNWMGADDWRAYYEANQPGNALSPPGIRAYHGSPHDFDRFDMSKIGTGEGAQAYGHGLYFAEAEDVAKQYRKRLSDGPTFADGTIVPDRLAVLLEDNKTIDGAIDAARYRYSVALDELNAYNSKPQDWRNAWGETRDSIVEKLRLRLPMEKQEVDEIVSELELLRGKVIKQPGAMYEVRINADPNDFLDWDKPLSQQSKVAELVGRDDQGRLMLPNGERAAPDKLRGESFYRAFAESRGGGTQPGSQALRDAGIPGIKYLDQGSRTAGEGSRNYVVFRDDIIDIVKKYGIAAAASMYGMDQVQRVMLADQLQPAAQ